MATTTTILNPVNDAAAQITKIYWLTASEEDAKVFEGHSHGGGYLSLSDGKALTTWTAGKELGEWPDSLKGIDVYVAFPVVLVVKSKVMSMLKELHAHINALGGSMYLLELPNGDTVSEAFGSGLLGSVKDKAKELCPALQGTKVSDGDTVGKSESEILYNIANHQFNFFMSDKGEPFLVLKEGPRYAWMLNGGIPNLADYLIDQYRQETLKVPNSGNVRDALATIKARCSSRTTPRKPLNLRSATSEKTGDYWLDLGREDGQCVKFGPNGWEITMNTPNDIFFRRTNSIFELPIPVGPEWGTEKEVLRDTLGTFVNVDEADWSLLVSWMVAHLIPTYTPPIAILVSSADSGKSTATMALRYAVEGKMVKGKNMNSDEKDMAVTMAAERVTVFNNVSKITKKQSDFLCDVIDGTEREARTLRTDSDVTTLKIDSSILMNGITTGELKGDFKTRAVVLQLSPIAGQRRSDEEIKRALIKAHPMILGALLNVAVRVSQRASEQVLDTSLSLRLVDYVRTVMAIDEIWELHGQGVNRYVAALKEMASSAVDDLMFKVVHELAVREVNWDGHSYKYEVMVDDLMGYLNEAKNREYLLTYGKNDHRAAWTTGAAVSASIRKVEPDWKRLEVRFESLGQVRRNGKKGTVLRFTFTPSANGDTEWALHYEKSPVSVISTDRVTS